MGQSEECLGFAGSGAHADIIYIMYRGSQSRLAKFQGHPGKRSPKARIHLMLGSVFPSKFKSVPLASRFSSKTKSHIANLTIDTAPNLLSTVMTGSCTDPSLQTRPDRLPRSDTSSIITRPRLTRMATRCSTSTSGPRSTASVRGG